jgi:hypothetical protein
MLAGLVVAIWDTFRQAPAVDGLVAPQSEGLAEGRARLYFTRVRDSRGECLVMTDCFFRSTLPVGCNSLYETRPVFCSSELLSVRVS